MVVVLLLLCLFDTRFGGHEDGSPVGAQARVRHNLAMRTPRMAELAHTAVDNCTAAGLLGGAGGFGRPHAEGQDRVSSPRGTVQIGTGQSIEGRHAFYAPYLGWPICVASGAIQLTRKTNCPAAGDRLECQCDGVGLQPRGPMDGQTTRRHTFYDYAHLSRKRRDMQNKSA